MNVRLPCLPIVLVLVLALAGCARAADRAAETGAPPPSPTDRQPTEQITPGAVAVLVREHLGAGAIRGFGSHGPERDAVSVMVRIEGAPRRDMFGITVYGPDHPEARVPGGGPGGGCRAMEQGGREGTATQCVELAGDGIATVSTLPSGFSDDNARGSVLMGSAYSPGRGVAFAMYESYSTRMPVDADAVLRLMSDPRLAWETDPGLNDAGEEVAVDRLEG